MLNNINLLLCLFLLCMISSAIHLCLAVKMGAAIRKFYGSSFRSHPRPAIFSCKKTACFAA